jgi:hypothetical protein
LFNVQNEPKRSLHIDTMYHLTMSRDQKSASLQVFRVPRISFFPSRGLRLTGHFENRCAATPVIVVIIIFGQQIDRRRGSEKCAADGSGKKKKKKRTL